MELLKHAITATNEEAKQRLVIFTQPNKVTTLFDYETQLLDAVAFARDNKDTIISFFIGELGNFHYLEMGSKTGTLWLGWAHMQDQAIELEARSLFEGIQDIPMGITEAFMYKAMEY